MGGTVLSGCLAVSAATGHRAAGLFSRTLVSRSTAALTFGSFFTGGTGMPKGWGLEAVEGELEKVDGGRSCVAVARELAALPSNGLPHIPQKRNCSELSSPHLGQITIVLPFAVGIVYRGQFTDFERRYVGAIILDFLYPKIRPVRDHAENHQNT
jgi:hypothetical protein